MTSPSRRAAGFVIGHVRRRMRMSLTLLAILTIAALCAVAAQYALKLMIDDMTASGAGRDGVLGALALFLGFLGVECLCWRLGGFVGSRGIIDVGEDIRADLFEEVSGQPWAFYNDQASGALTSRIMTAAGAASGVMRTVAWNLLPPAADVFGSVVVLLAIDWPIGIAMILIASLSGLALHRMGLRGAPLHLAYHREAADVAGSFADALANMALIRANGARVRERSELRRRMRTEGRAHAASWRFLERLRCWHDVAFWLTNAVVLTAAVLRWRAGGISTGSVLVICTLTLRVLVGSREIALTLLGVGTQLGAVSEALAVLHADPAAQARPLPPLRAGAGALHLCRVAYGPEGVSRLFEGLDLRIPAGQRVGIVGPSGAGKSTLLRLIQGVIRPQAGSVLIDGQDLAAHAADSLSDVFSVVSQETLLLQRSLRENLCYGRPAVSWDEALAVSRALGCHAFVDGLALGYETFVGERGIRLSGGQRQRLAIARALLRQAPVMLLDEATSALDSQAESEVQQAILDLAGERTLIAVAHRLSTVMAFDRIIVLSDGVVIEDAPPLELCRASGYFATAWRLQQRGDLRGWRGEAVAAT